MTTTKICDKCKSPRPLADFQKKTKSLKKNAKLLKTCKACREKRYHNFDPQLSKSEKERKLRGVVYALLIDMRMTIAVPEPDLGQDLWVSVSSSTASHVAQIFRAQAKSSSSYDSQGQKNSRRYTINVKAANFESSVRQPLFVYFFGLRDDRINIGYKNLGYHIGCVPGGFLSRFLGNKLFGIEDDKRVRLAFDVFGAEPPFTYNLFGGRGCNLDVTRYFQDVQTGIDEAVEQVLQLGNRSRCE
jgi:hypothetical protein